MSSTDPNYQPDAQNPWRPVDPAAQPVSTPQQPVVPAPQHADTTGDPFGQPLAAPYGQPYGQPSAPYGQTSATPYGQPSAPAGWENTGTIPTMPQSNPSAVPGDEFTGVVPGMSGMNRPVAPQPPKEPSPAVVALTDFGFTRFGAHDLAKIAYALVCVMVVLRWVIDVVYGFAGPLGAGDGGGGNVFTGLGALLLGWVPAAATIIVTRILLEVAVAVVDGRTKKDDDASVDAQG